MTYRTQWGPVAVQRTDAVDRKRTAPHASHIRSATDVALRPVAPAETAQARLFEKILRAEIAELVALPPEVHGEMRPRIQELDGLIRALRDRFPFGPTTATPPVRTLHSPANGARRAFLN